MPYDPRKAAAKQVRRAQEASGDYVEGVKNTTVNPMERAAAKKEKMKANVNKAIDDGTWETALRSVPVEEWKKKTAEKGGSRYAEGVQSAENDIIAFHEEFSGAVARAQAAVEAMPDTTLEQRIARMTTNARELAKFKRAKRRR